MSPAAAFHAQLASIMEVLANTAVAEICELVDNGYSVLQLEISRSRKENEVLRRKLRLMELRTARATALRAAVTASGTAVLHASGRARAELRRSSNPTGEVVLSRVSNQETSRSGDHSPPAGSRQESMQRMQPADETAAAVIKVEDDDGVSWSQSEPDKGFCRVEEGQMEAEAPIKQEAGNDGGVSWMSGEVSSTSAQNTQRSETSSYDCLIFEPQLQLGSCASQNSLGAEAGCSSASDSGGSFPFPLSEASLSAAERPAGFQNSQQRVAPADELPVRKETAGDQRSFIRRGGWRQQDAVSRAASHRGEDSGGKSFVCNCCGKTLACLKNLKTHMRVHTGEKPFVCALCGKRFSDSSNLKRHQSVHTGEKRYGCVHCGKRFAQSGSLKVHMTVHTDCKQFRCSYCNKTFISGSHLRRHITVHAGEKRFGAAVQ